MRGLRGGFRALIRDDANHTNTLHHKDTDGRRGLHLKSPTLSLKPRPGGAFVRCGDIAYLLKLNTSIRSPIAGVFSGT